MDKQYIVKPVDITTGGKNVIIVNHKDAEDLDVRSMDRLKVVFNNKEVSAIVDLTSTYVKPGHVAMFSELAKKLKIKEGQKVCLEPTKKPVSVSYIRHKMDGLVLQPQEIETIIDDVMDERLSEVELTAFISAVYMKGITEEETIALTKSIINSGDRIEWMQRPVMDKHSIGGVPGNRTSMLLVPIIASTGLLIPKTSSRAITSPAGTADSMEVLTPVNLDMDRIKKVVNKTNGCLVWGGAVNLAAADDKLIKVRHPLALDPRGMLLASILAKKKAAGSTHVLIDISIGKGAKIFDEEEAKKLAEDFMALGTKLGMEVECILTPGYDPIGFAVGPALEAREVMRILEGKDYSADLREKGEVMAGILLEMGDKARSGEGDAMAQKAIDSGDALEKMREIIKAQGGKPIESDKMKMGKYHEDVKAKESGRIQYMNTNAITSICRAAGAPSDKNAGIYMYVEKGDKIKKGQKLLTIYSDSEYKLQAALELAEKLQPVEMAKVVLETFSTEEMPRIHEF